ncbi:MAG: response regulator transcription factor [Flavobacteriales bacterium]
MTAFSQSRILLVDDEEDILDMIGFNLEEEGYDVETAKDGHEALKKASKFKPDLILLDVMMPEMDGMETCTELRKDVELRGSLIAFLTARSEDYSQIAGFEAGADDYIAKPVKPKVLLSRVKALLRRPQLQKDEARSDEAGGVRVDKEQYLVFKGGEEMSLPKKEFELLALLISKAGKVFTRDEILSGVWGDDVVVGDRTIDVHIRKLREKIGESYIHTVKGVGYKFEAPE